MILTKESLYTSIKRLITSQMLLFKYIYEFHCWVSVNSSCVYLVHFRFFVCFLFADPSQPHSTLTNPYWNSVFCVVQCWCYARRWLFTYECTIICFFFFLFYIVHNLKHQSKHTCTAESEATNGIFRIVPSLDHLIALHI